MIDKDYARVKDIFFAAAELEAGERAAFLARHDEAGSVDGIPFLALEWVNGPSLSATRAVTSLAEKVALVREVARGLHAVHRRGIAHLDVKPSNILVGWDREGGLKPYLADFGIAREMPRPRAGSAAEPGRAGPRRLVGTPSFIAPERLRAPREVDPRNDVYALGVTSIRETAARLDISPATVKREWRLAQAWLRREMSVGRRGSEWNLEG